jgi:hypothetical protein
MTSTNCLRYAGWAAILSAAATGMMTITGILMFVSLPFAVVTDIISVLQVVLTIPLALGLHLLLQSEAPALGLTATAIGLVGMLVKAVFQSLLVLGVLTYAQSSPATEGIAPAAIGIWLLLSNYRAWQAKLFPRGLIWAGFISGIGYLVFIIGFWTGGLQSPLLWVGSAAAGWAYLIWALWLGRRLLAHARAGVQPARPA